jgi:anaphase-promoting complex subunit 3
MLQHPPTRERRKPTQKARSKSIESEADDDAFHSADLEHSQSPPPNAHSPGSVGTPTSSTWTVAHEQAAQEEYEQELADDYLYEITRRFANATRALSMYDCRKCLDELEELPDCHQHSAWVLAMVGRAHYERLEYAAVRGKVLLFGFCTHNSMWAIG